MRASALSMSQVTLTVPGSMPGEENGTVKMGLTITMEAFALVIFLALISAGYHR